jgi:hypothetical protein
MQLSDAGLERLAALTEGFSFAYLKELVLSAMMRWIHEAGEMEPVMAGQVDALREQMQSARDEPPTGLDEPVEE